MGTTASDSCCFTVKGISKIINIQYKSYLPLLSMLNHVKLTKGKYSSHKITASFCQSHVHAFELILFHWTIVKWLLPVLLLLPVYSPKLAFHEFNKIKKLGLFSSNLIKTKTSYQETKTKSDRSPFSSAVMFVIGLSLVRIFGRWPHGKSHFLFTDLVPISLRQDKG